MMMMMMMSSMNKFIIDMAERKEFEGFLLESETKHASLEQELTKVQDKLDNSEKEKATLTERVQDLERQLRELRASMDSSMFLLGSF